MTIKIKILKKGKLIHVSVSVCVCERGVTHLRKYKTGKVFEFFDHVTADRWQISTFNKLIVLVNFALQSRFYIKANSNLIKWLIKDFRKEFFIRELSSRTLINLFSVLETQDRKKL